MESAHRGRQMVACVVYSIAQVAAWRVSTALEKAAEQREFGRWHL